MFIEIYETVYNYIAKKKRNHSNLIALIKDLIFLINITKSIFAIFLSFFLWPLDDKECTNVNNAGIVSKYSRMPTDVLLLLFCFIYFFLFNFKCSRLASNTSTSEKSHIGLSGLVRPTGTIVLSEKKEKYKGRVREMGGSARCCCSLISFINIYYNLIHPNPIKAELESWR